MKQQRNSDTTVAEKKDPHVVLYYSNLRRQLLRSVKPKEKPLKLRLSTRDFRVSHRLDDTEQMEDMIDDMRPSFWPKKQKRGIQRRSIASLRQQLDSSDSDDPEEVRREEYISSLKNSLNEIPQDSRALEFVQKRQQAAKRPVIVDRTNDFSMGSEKKKKTSESVVRTIVHGWVEEGCGGHIPKVEFTNSDRTILSQLEKGGFRFEVPPRPPFFVTQPDLSRPASQPQSRSSTPEPQPVRTSSAPLERPSRVATDGTIQSLAASDDSGKPTIMQEYMEKISNQPIRSYRAFFNATVKPEERPLVKPKKLLQGSAYYEQKLLDTQHRFDHLRFEKQVDIENFTSWRGKCRGVVSAHFADNKEDGPVLEQQLGVYGRRENPHLRSTTQGKSGGIHSSVWTTKAMHLAVAEERNRICHNIENFKLDFNAATLSKEAMEKLRSEVLQRIRAKPCNNFNNALFSKNDFIRFLSNRTKRSLQTDLPVFTSAGPIDVVDAMASPAEAAFAKYVLQVLPT